MLENLKLLLDELNRFKISYCVIGGIAILLYGGRSSTIDFDLYILTSEKEHLLKVFQKLGIQWSDAGEFQIKAKFENLPIDVLIADKWVGRPALKRARFLKLGASKARVASPEDIIIMKAIADRPVDRRDIDELKELFGKDIDSNYIIRRLTLIKKALDG